jgi:hypothetical protein
MDGIEKRVTSILSQNATLLPDRHLDYSFKEHPSQLIPAPGSSYNNQANMNPRILQDRVRVMKGLRNLKKEEVQHLVALMLDAQVQRIPG